MASSSNLLSNRAFPNELIDSIIDHNFSDRRTLRTCALVSRQWVTGSRYHLFSTVAISHEEAPKFLHLLNDPNCTFATALRSLDVHIVPGPQRWFAEFSSELERMNITSLSFLGSRSTIVGKELGIAAVSSYPQVRNLSIGPLAFESFADFTNLAAGFQSLTSLSSAATFRLFPSPSERPNFTTALRILELTSPAITPTLAFLRSHNNVLCNLISLSLLLMTSEDIPELKFFLEQPNSMLHALKITMDFSSSGIDLGEFMHQVNLTHQTALATLWLHTIPALSPEESFTILNTAASSSLQTVKLSIRIMAGIARVDRLLTSDRFAALQKVVIFDADWPDTRQYLPRCASNNILQQP